MDQTLFLPLAGLLLGLGGLWYTSEKSVEVSLALSHKLSLNALFVGVIFMAMVTGLPELIVGIMSVLNGVAQMSVGDIMGSNFVDTVLVIGVSILAVGPLNIAPQRKKRILSLLILVVLTMAFLFYLQTITKLWGAILFLSYFVLILFLWYFHSAPEIDNAEISHAHKAFNTPTKLTLGVIGSFAGLFLSTELALWSAKSLAETMALPLEFLGVTVFAVSTSLPEFAISIHAARRKQTGLLLGNAFGAALQQGLFTLGAVALCADKPLNLGPVMSLIPYMAAGFLLLGVTIYRYRTLSTRVGSALVSLGALSFLHQVYLLL